MVTLARKVLVPTVLLGVVLAGAVAILAWDSVRASRTLERGTGTLRVSTALALALEGAFRDQDRAVLSLAPGADPAREAGVASASARVAELGAEIGRLELAPRARAIWAQLEASRASLAAIRDAALESARRGDERALALELDRWRLMATRADALLEDFAGYHLRALDRTVAALEAGRSRALRGTLVAALLGLLAAVALAVAIGRAVVRPIAAVARDAERIADTVRPAVVEGADRDDEVGTLARSLNRMTERLFAANAQLAEADRRKDEFLGVLSHELRNPLAPLRHALYVLERAEPASAAAQRARAVMDRQVAHLARLVDDLLDVTRIARGKIELRRTPLDLADVVRRCADDHAAVMAERGLDLRVEVPAAGSLPVDGDETRLAQIVGNLLQNAAKFTPAGGRISLRARRDGQAAEVRVEDTGSGIDPQLLPRIFEPFTQAEQTLARSEGGLGLGLSLVRGIVELHGGTVEARSEGAGHGSVFVVRLPLAPGGAASLGAPPAAGSTPSGPGDLPDVR